MSTISDLVVAMRLDPTGFSRGLGQARQQVTAFNRALGGLGAGLALMKVGGFVKETVDLAARYETLGVVMTVVGNNAGKTRAQMDELEQKLADTGISVLQARNNLIKMAQANLDLSRAADVGRAAQNAAVIANLNSSEAFEKVIHGIQSGRTIVLRNIGIMVNFEQAYKRAEAQLGKTKAQMTETEKANIRMNETMRATKVIAGAYEAAFATAGKQLRSTERFLEDMKVKAGTAFLPAYTKAVFGYANALKFLGNNASTVSGVIGGMTAALTALTAVLTGKAILAFFALLGSAALPVTIVLGVIATIFYKITKNSAEAAAATMKYHDALQALGAAELQQRLRNLAENQAALLDRFATGTERPGDAELFKRMEQRGKDLRAALANIQLAGAGVGEEPPIVTESRAALRRLEALRIEAPIFVAAQKKVADAFLSGGVAAGEYAQHLAEVTAEQEQAAKNLTGAKAAEARKLEGTRQAALWTARLAEATAQAREQARLEVREAKQASLSVLLWGQAVEDAAIQLEYSNKVQDIRNKLTEHSSEIERKSAEDMVVAAAKVRDHQEQALSLQRLIAPWKAGLMELENVFVGFWQDLVTDSRSAWKNVAQGFKRIVGAVVGELAKQVFQVKILPKIAGAFGLDARAQLAANTNMRAAQLMYQASINNLRAAGQPVPIQAPPGGAGGAASSGSKILGGASIALAGFGAGKLAGGLTSSKLGAVLLGGASGAAVGAAIGTFIFPVIGTAVGALIGGVAGMIGGWFGRKKKPPIEIETLIRGLEFDSTKVQSMAELRKKQADIVKKLQSSLGLEERIELEGRLKQINDALAGATGAVNNFTDAMYNVPDIFKVALATFTARKPDFGGAAPPPITGGGGGGGYSGGGGSGGGGPATPEQTPTYVFQVNAMDRTIDKVIEEVELAIQRRSLARYGSSAGVGLVVRPEGAW